MMYTLYLIIIIGNEIENERLIMSKWEEHYCTIIIPSRTFDCKSLLHQTDKKNVYYAMLTVLLYVGYYTLAQRYKQNKTKKWKEKMWAWGGGGESLRKISYVPATPRHGSGSHRLSCSLVPRNSRVGSVWIEGSITTSAGGVYRSRPKSISIRGLCCTL